MKNSVLGRLLVIFIILIGWWYSLYPINGRPFYEVLREEVNQDKDIGDIEKVIKKAKEIEKSRTEEGLAISPGKALKLAATDLKVNLREFISIYNQPKASNDVVINFIRRKAAGKIRLGLDLKGGTEFIIAFDEDEFKKNEPEKEMTEAQGEIIEILRNRVDQSGIVEAEIKPIGPSTISLKIPSIDTDEIQNYRELIQRTAKLDFRLVHENNASLLDQEKAEDFIPPVAFERMEMATSSDAEAPTQILYVKRIPESVGGKHINRAYPNVNQFGSYSVSLEFNHEGAKLFHDVTSASTGRRLAVVLDGTVYSAPNINEPIAGGRAEISGSFSSEEATNLGVVLRCGNLPVAISIEGEFSTDPTLGKDSVESGKNASIWGLAAVIIFMVIYYRSAGLIANIALAANILLVLGTLTIAGATITLPGIAGIVLTIGMAVDANVLIFERIREELENKKSIANAIHTGYNRAFVTILDANLTTLFTALILYKFGSGPIRGFAVTLSIGIVASLFTALFMTRTIFDFSIWVDRFKKLNISAWISVKHVKFLSFRKFTSIASFSLIALALVTMAYCGKSSLSVDFMGGSAITFNYINEISPSKISDALANNGYKKTRIAYKASANQETRLLEIVLSGSIQKDKDVKSDIRNLLNKNFPEAKLSGGSEKRIGALVGNQFMKQAIYAAAWALATIIIYITIRFEFSYALGAVAALAHDVMICTGLFLVANMGERQISLPVIAALLTIMGYSLNDTIVVFDRIRENFGLIKNMSPKELINLSLNQTFSRTILTSFTTLIVVAILYIFGGGAINDFALIMLIGVLIGTYSSIFIATPIMMFFREREERKGAIAAVTNLKESTA